MQGRVSAKLGELRKASWGLSQLKGKESISGGQNASRDIYIKRQERIFKHFRSYKQLVSDDQKQLAMKLGSRERWQVGKGPT